ncbi:MAG: DeoR/GlpR family DNA-binding transcription regulator [Alphaproteobacteria bacterium]|nr:DeoR/GlpR family DNA-binding transcription regulator [Alphaproteobacteria bacterium]MBU0798152.1 DeoR/GlpR family DNA-binding transcription regulator [Alphaproteobacteria bacterium]MBU0887031.1 DeoR/GlpR family DNA-binding transcription regulator [Alphaproteobacteria bacterium]MBU1814281.1 DeoR/GlpR family DNA-binding transcription regulator [Alphaproteobacteria bacterium]MBU2091706.1 DeoR/GlpR family DNA-binding transcription regulator [Alphaproteobacteria bacterium]
MNLSSRQSDIIALIRHQGFQTIEALASHFQVTPQTIRRDVNNLCDANILRRRHGGAELLGVTNASYESRRVTNLQAKRRIGAAVAALIPSHSSVLFGIGTTPEQVALAMGSQEDLTVITNNLNIATAMSANGSSRILLPGGTLRLPDRDLLGPQTEALFRSFRADFGVYGVGGIDLDGTLLDFDRDEVAAREAIRESCRTSILVADTSKIGRIAPAQGGFLWDADIIVMDSAPSEPLAGLLTASPSRLIIADAREDQAS